MQTQVIDPREQWAKTSALWPSDQPGAPQLVGDVTGWLTYATPADDIHGALVAALQAIIAKYGAQNVELHASEYAFADMDVAVLYARFGANPASRFVLDSTQAVGYTESPVVAHFKTLVSPDQLVIGTSPVGHEILHTKARSVLCPDGSGWTMTGSWNVSASAQEEFNIDDAIWSRSRAELFAQTIDGIFNWVQQNEPNNQ